MPNTEPIYATVPRLAELFGIPVRELRKVISRGNVRVYVSGANGGRTRYNVASVRLALGRAESNKKDGLRGRTVDYAAIIQQAIT